MNALRVAVVSDTHGNLAALEAVLADAAKAGAETLWNLGDAVDYGPQANETLALLQEHGSVHLAGNHDLALNERLPLEDFSKLAQACVHYSRATVSQEHAFWLADLEPSAVLTGDFAGVELYHGSPADPAWGYLDTREGAASALSLRPEARLVLVGHSHRQGAWRERADLPAENRRRVREHQLRPLEPFDLGPHRWVLNAGSVGFPNEHRGDHRAGYLLLDFTAKTAEFRRVEYDRELTRAALRATTLPVELQKMV